MSELLTKEEYNALAKGLNLPVNAFIDGKFQPSTSGKRFETVNPATGNVIAEITACNRHDVDHAVEKASLRTENGTNKTSQAYDQKC